MCYVNLSGILAIPDAFFRFSKYIRIFTRKFVVKIRAERFLSRVNRLRRS